jgi:hypothetical protein
MKLSRRMLPRIRFSWWLPACGLCLGLIPSIYRHVLRLSPQHSLAEVGIYLLITPVFMIAGGLAFGGRLANEEGLELSFLKVSGFSRWLKLSAGGFIVTVISAALTIAPSFVAGTTTAMSSHDLQFTALF